jgi:hypothetical protein
VPLAWPGRCLFQFAGASRERAGTRLDGLESLAEARDGFAMLEQVAVREKSHLQVSDASERGALQLRAHFVFAS